MNRDAAIRYGCSAAIIAIPIVLFLALCTGGEPAPDLPIDARFTGTQVQVTNEGATDWTDCRMTLNDEWTRTASRIGAGATVTAGIATFTRGDGQRFNPFTHEVRSLGVSCDVAGQFASYYGALR